MVRSSSVVFFPCLALTFAAAGCTSAAEKAEKSYDLASKNDLQPHDRCVAARRVKEAYLAEGNEVKYELWSNKEFNACAASRRLGI